MMLGLSRDLLSRPVRAANKRFYSLDLLRGLAALAILIFHFKNFAAGGASLNRPASALDHVSLLGHLSAVRTYGSWSVMLFWMLSGFVFMNVYGSAEPSARKFWVNRLARLYPLHLLTLLIIVLIQFFAVQRLGHWLIFPADSAIDFVKQLFFASAWVNEQRHSFNGPIWSVSVEILIYGCFFAYARTVPNNLLTSGLALAAFALLIPLTHGANFAVCGLFFFGGAIAYSLFQFCPASKRRTLMVASIVIFATLAAAGVRFGQHSHIPLSLWLMPIFAAMMMVAACVEESGLSAIFRRTRFVGDITYSTYLWHSPLQMLFLLGAGFGYWSVDAAFSNVFFVAYLSTVCAVAWLSFRCIERPAQALVREALLDRPRDIQLIAAP